MRRPCFCGFDDYRYAKVEKGHLHCPYCQGEIVCEPLPESLCSSAQVYARMALELRQKDQEEFWVITLNVRNRPTGRFQIAKGSMSETVVHPREVFASAIAKRAAAIILLHNHPSGDFTPSPEDERLTWRLVEVGKLLGIPVLDHIVVSTMGYASFRDLGMLEGQPASAMRASERSR